MVPAVQWLASGVRQRSRRSQEIRGSAPGHGALRLPAKCRRHLAGDRVQHLRVVLDAKPASGASTRLVAIRVIGRKVRPRPRLNGNTPTSTFDA